MERRLGAILAADIAGYSQLMGVDEDGTVQALKGHQEEVLPLVAKFGGRIIDTAGDGILAEFPSVIAAVECATDISLDIFVSDLETVCHATKLERFALLGISQGCAVSIAYAVRHPERVSHLVLYGGYALGRSSRPRSESQKEEDAAWLPKFQKRVS